MVASAVLFGVFHAPALLVLFADPHSLKTTSLDSVLGHVPVFAWVWLILFNGILGVVCGLYYLRWGIGAAVLIHFGTDLVWHVLSQLG